MTRYLSTLDLIGIHTRLMETAGTRGALLDAGKLESAARRPQWLAHYQEVDLFAQAAALVTGLALAHAFSDGNKRLAFVAGNAFLAENGYHVEADPITFADQVLVLVNRQGSLEDATAALATWLQTHSTTDS